MNGIGRRAFHDEDSRNGYRGRGNSTASSLVNRSGAVGNFGSTPMDPRRSQERGPFQTNGPQEGSCNRPQRDDYDRISKEPRPGIPRNGYRSTNRNDDSDEEKPGGRFRGPRLLDEGPRGNERASRSFKDSEESVIDGESRGNNTRRNPSAFLSGSGAVKSFGSTPMEPRPSQQKGRFQTDVPQEGTYNRPQHDDYRGSSNMLRPGFDDYGRISNGPRPGFQRNGYRSTHANDENDDEKPSGRFRGPRLDDRYPENERPGRSFKDREEERRGPPFVGRDERMGTEGMRMKAFIPKEIPLAELFENSLSCGDHFKKFGDLECRVDDKKYSEKWQDFSQLKKVLRDNIHDMGYHELTPIQSCALPLILSGRDLTACAQTGSGKTAAFVLPIMEQLLGDMEHPPRPRRPRVLILSPTRELASQIHDECRKFGRGSGIACTCIYGQVSIRHQLNILHKGVDILVATPGRLCHFIREEEVLLDAIEFLVLDEADRILAGDYSLEVLFDSPALPPRGKKQTILVSATFPEKVKELANRLMKNSLHLTVGELGAANMDIKQNVIRVPAAEKHAKVVSVLRDAEFVGCKTLIFTQMKKNTDLLACYIMETVEELEATTIHGDRMQPERELALGEFKSGRKMILIATDCASRGLDIPKVDHVINFDLPDEIESYVHRIGRTGRIGHQGIATSFYDPEEDGGIAVDLVHTLASAHQEVPSWLQKEAERGREPKSTYGKFGGYGGVGRGKPREDYLSGGGMSAPSKKKEQLEDEELWD